MVQLTVTAKGQITLKKELLARLGVKPGDKVDVSIDDQGRAVLEAAQEHSALEAFLEDIESNAARKRDLGKIFGAHKRDGDPVISVEEINEAIAEGWAKGDME